MIKIQQLIRANLFLLPLFFKLYKFLSLLFQPLRFAPDPLPAQLQLVKAFLCLFNTGIFLFNPILCLSQTDLMAAQLFCAAL